MTFHADAIYEGGVLRPLMPLELEEHEVVSLAISTADHKAETSIAPQDEWEHRLLGLAKDCGISLPNTAVSSEGLYE